MNNTIHNTITCPRIRNLSKLRNEVFVVLYLCEGKFIGNANYDCIGTPDYVHFPDVDIVLSNCKKLNTSSILLLHNHPGYRNIETLFMMEYDPQPSIRDIASTRIFSESVKKHGITVLDHIIVCGDDSYFSFVENGLI